MQVLDSALAVIALAVGIVLCEAGGWCPDLDRQLEALALQCVLALLLFVIVMRHVLSRQRKRVILGVIGAILGVGAFVWDFRGLAAELEFSYRERDLAEIVERVREKCGHAGMAYDRWVFDRHFFWTGAGVEVVVVVDESTALDTFCGFAWCSDGDLPQTTAVYTAWQRYPLSRFGWYAVRGEVRPP